MTTKSISEKSLAGLFEFHRSRVTEDDIRDMVPSDPGSGGYVRFLKEVRETGLLPDREDPDLWEVVCSPPVSLKATVPSSRVSHYQESMVRYRNFVFSISLGSIDTGANGDWIWIHPISWLLEDANRHDRSYLRLLRSALTAAGRKLADTIDDPASPGPPFFTLGALVLSGWLNDSSGMSEAARQLIRDDGKIRTAQRTAWGQASPGFLWDLQSIVSKDRLAALKHMVMALENPAGDSDVELVLRSL